jgi:hypothetical protein
MWRLERVIRDRLSGTDGRFRGRARIWKSLDGLVYEEEGQLAFGTATPMAATRRYIWQIPVPGRVEVFFDDGRFFHAFVTAGRESSARHFCTPDDYHVTYRFSTPSRWSSEWDVNGPKKSYHLTSAYSR